MQLVRYQLVKTLQQHIHCDPFDLAHIVNLEMIYHKQKRLLVFCFCYYGKIMVWVQNQPNKTANIFIVFFSILFISPQEWTLQGFSMVAC